MVFTNLWKFLSKGILCCFYDSFILESFKANSIFGGSANGRFSVYFAYEYLRHISYLDLHALFDDATLTSRLRF